MTPQVIGGRCSGGLTLWLGDRALEGDGLPGDVKHIGPEARLQSSTVPLLALFPLHLFLPPPSHFGFSFFPCSVNSWQCPPPPPPDAHCSHTALSSTLHHNTLPLAPSLLHPCGPRECPCFSLFSWTGPSLGSHLLALRQKSEVSSPRGD